MIEYSDEQLKEMDLYVKRLVKAQPLWLKKLFIKGEAAIGIDQETGQLVFEINPKLSIDRKAEALTHVYRYFQKHPSEYFELGLH